MTSGRILCIFNEDSQSLTTWFVAPTSSNQLSCNLTHLHFPSVRKSFFPPFAMPSCKCIRRSTRCSLSANNDSVEINKILRINSISFDSFPKTKDRFLSAIPKFSFNEINYEVFIARPLSRQTTKQGEKQWGAKTTESSKNHKNYIRNTDSSHHRVERALKTKIMKRPLDNHMYNNKNETFGNNNWILNFAYCRCQFLLAEGEA